MVYMVTKESDMHARIKSYEAEVALNNNDDIIIIIRRRRRNFI